MAQGEKQYDVALSFAGEDRACAEALAESLKGRQISVFYDQYEKTALWGKDLYSYLSQLYQNQARYCVMFISKYYAAKLWTNLERKAAQARAFQENYEYILPIRLDDTDIPGLLLTVGYLNWHHETISSITDAIINKLGRNSALPKFSFEYQGLAEPGLRFWYQLDEVKWVEQYPSGHTTTFVIVDRTRVEGVMGTVVRKVEGKVKKTGVRNYTLEAFIPDKEAESKWLLFRHRYSGEWVDWIRLAEVTFLE